MPSPLPLQKATEGPCVFHTHLEKGRRLPNPTPLKWLQLKTTAMFGDAGVQLHDLSLRSCVPLSTYHYYMAL